MSLGQNLSQPMNQTVEVIGFGRRFVAYIIDLTVLGVAQIAVLVCGDVVLTMTGITNEGAAGFGTLLECLSQLISVGYFVGFLAIIAQTPGKMVVGVKVVATDGRSVSWGTAILRYIGYIISGLVFGLGFTWIGFDAKRQGWHDKIANTYVVDKDTHFSSVDAVTIVPADTGSLVNLLGLIPIFILGVIVVIALLLFFGPILANLF